MKNTKKGVSEIVTITLIIVITVIIAGMFFAWTKNSAKTRLDEVSAELKSASDLECSNAKFYVDSCTIYSTTKTVRLTLINNSNLKLFNLNLSINGDTSVAGAFQDIINSGETAYFSTDTNFNFTRGNQEALNNMNIDLIDNITLTNGTCPKEILDISGCTIVNALWPPTSNVSSGTYYLEQEVTLSAEDGATIYYTLDGNTPTTDSNVYSTPITIPEDANTTLKAIASAESSLASDVNTWVYNITHTLDAPTADPVAGTYYGTTDVTLSAEEGADIYYRLNFGQNTLYTTPIMLPSLNGIIQTITATAQKAGYGTSSQFYGDYTINDSNDNLIYMFNLKGAGYDINGTIDNDANTITAEFPAGTNLSKLVGSINVHIDATVNPEVSKISDYSNPVQFTVTAGNDSDRIYTVTATTVEEISNSIVYDTPTKILTIILDPDISLEEGVAFFVYDDKEVEFIATDKIKTTDEMGKVKPSPYDLSDEALSSIGFDPELFLSKYPAGISHFDIVDDKDNILATIPVADIIVNLK